MSPFTTSRRSRAAIGASAAAALAIAGMVATAPGSHAAGAALSPAKDVSIRAAGSPTAIPGSYVVVLSGDRSTASTMATTQSVATSYNVKVRHNFSSSVKGFSANMTEDQAKKLASDSRVAFVEQNQKVTVSEDDPPWGGQDDPPWGGQDDPPWGGQDNPPWGLDRLDQRDLPMDHVYNQAITADNVSVYVIDTGIYAAHNDFEGRASVGTDTIGDGKNGVDCHGHGSHVAGTIAGAKYGVAKRAKVYGVRVLNCTGVGTIESVVAGIEWVTAHAKKPAVANMSLRSAPDPVMDAAVKASIDSGVTYSVAAGNESSDACTISPARVPSAITVGATDNTDAKAAFSNYGRCVDVFAPGVNVESVGITGPDAKATLSGTSMATPHVTGGAALYLCTHPDATPADVAAALTGAATPGKVGSPGAGSPNKLLYVGSTND
jgi:subtilisin family serine protease